MKGVNYPYTIFSDFEFPNNVPTAIQPADGLFNPALRDYYPWL